MPADAGVSWGSDDIVEIHGDARDIARDVLGAPLTAADVDAIEKSLDKIFKGEFGPGSLDGGTSTSGGTTPPPKTTPTKPPATSYTCSGSQVTLLDDTNGGVVSGGGTPPTFSTGGKAYCVTYIQTYHWNGGQGAAPGKLGLKPQGGGTAVGPFTAQASSGTNNAPNVNWYVYPSKSPPVVIDGTYACSDSGPGTWSADPSSGGQGFCIVQGVPAVAG